MKPFLQGKKSLAAPALRAPTAGAGLARACEASLSPGANLSAGNNASVEVVKQGDKVARLVVTCSCGERIEIDCIYPVGA
ncbi:MAG: hypothetical protein JWM32_1561 [Verrucomicrobia bacterium]|nr:hypothetical protein [Verrucomicrobiota bacterium]